jgi:hypothetical protein
MPKGDNSKGWAHRNKPARGGPASGMPARGEGWGGDKSGHEPIPFSADLQPSPEAKAIGVEAARTAKAVAKEHAEAMAKLLVTIANDPATPAPTRVDAANKLIERAEGKAVASVDMTSKGERVGYVIPAPAEARNADEWTAQHKPR